MAAPSGCPLFRGTALLCLSLWPLAAEPSAPLLHGVSLGARNERQHHVVEAFLHGWRGYKDACWGKDEVRPVSRDCTDQFGGLGMQIVDALDSLLLLGLRQEYREAREWVLRNFTPALDAKVSVFEVTIRLLGGLLSAYFLTGDSVLLQRAGSLGSRLLPAWQEGPLPHELVNLATGEAGAQDPTLGSSLAEVGSLQLEFKALSAAAGDPRFRWRADHVMELMGSLLSETGGLLPIMLLPSPPMHWTNPRVTLGGRGDSFYECLLKQWLQTNRTEPRLLQGYRAFVRAVRLALAGRSSPSNLSFVREAPTLEALQLPQRLDANEAWGPLVELESEVLGPLAFFVQVPGMEPNRVEEQRPSLDHVDATATCEGEADGGEAGGGGEEEGSSSVSEHGVPTWLREPDICSVREEPPPLLQALFGQKLVYVVIPQLKGEDICATAELLLTRRWDLLHGRIGVGLPRGMPHSEVVREGVAQLAGGQLAAQCERRGRFKMDHLSCFLPGVLALGVMTGAAVDADAELELAAGLAEACARMWLEPPLGLASESVAWNVVPGRPADMEVIEEAAYCSLRPETVESLWYLHLATGDRKYQDWGWSILEAIERHAKVPHGGYCGVEDVSEAEPRPRDLMETFVLSETFKYLFLLFADKSPFDLAKVVLTTEAHLLPVLDPALARWDQR